MDDCLAQSHDRGVFMHSHTHLVRYGLTLIHILSGFESYCPTGELTCTTLLYTHGGARQWTNLSTRSLAVTSERAGDTPCDSHVRDTSSIQQRPQGCCYLPSKHAEQEHDCYCQGFEYASLHCTACSQDME